MSYTHYLVVQGLKSLHYPAIETNLKDNLKGQSQRKHQLQVHEFCKINRVGPHSIRVDGPWHGSKLTCKCFHAAYIPKNNPNVKNAND